MLEQRKGRYDWVVMGGQSIESQPGTVTTNGRFARTIYGGKFGTRITDSINSKLTYFISADEPGSLSTDPDSPKYQGPSLTPQKNSGAGLALDWEPIDKLKFLADYQSNKFYADSAGESVADVAYRGKFQWERHYFKLSGSLQYAGPDFVAFGAPAIVGDRQTFTGGLNLYPVTWYTLAINGNQYVDNLENDPTRVTTTQRVVSLGNAFQFKTGTNVNLSVSMNTAEGKPKSALDNQTTTTGLGFSQTIGRHSVSLNGTLSQFKDNNSLADDLDTTTLSLATSLALPRSASASFGVTQSETKNKINGSKRTSQTVSPSYSKRINSAWVAQLWGTWTSSKNEDPLSLSDSTNLSVSSEMTWAKTRQLNLTFGLGINKNTDTVRTDNTFNEVVVSTRMSYSF
jgi:hypothetical protein